MFIEQAKDKLENLRAVKAQIDELKEVEKSLRDEIMVLLKDADITKFEDDCYKISYIAPTETAGIDTKKLEQKDAILYAELLNKYLKITKRGESIRVTFIEEPY